MNHHKTSVEYFQYWLLLANRFLILLHDFDTVCTPIRRERPYFITMVIRILSRVSPPVSSRSYGLSRLISSKNDTEPLFEIGYSRTICSPSSSLTANDFHPGKSPLNPSTSYSNEDTTTPSYAAELPSSDSV